MFTFSELRYKLTFLYTAVLAGISLFTAIFLYISIWANIETTSSDSLKLSAEQLASAYEYYEVSGQNSTNLDAITESLSRNDTTYRIFNQNFDIVLSSENEPVNEEIGMKLIKKFFADHSDEANIQSFSRGAQSYKVCTDIYVTGSGKLICVQLVKNMSSEREVLTGPFLIVLFIILVGIILSFVLGNFLATRALKPIKQSYEQQRKFLNDASHELRTPVAVILSNLEALKKDKDPGNLEDNKWLNNAYSETKRTKAVVEDLLLLAKTDAGEQVSALEPLDLSYLLLEVTENLENLALKKDITLKAEINAMDVLVLGDQTRLSELFIILIDNAIKYTNPGGTITVTLTKEEDTVKVDVSDTGIGIPFDEQNKIFDRFYRVDKARSRQEGGTGLGLSIAQWIIKEHNIKLRLHSVENEGTTFSLTFPLYKTD